ncbi:MAG: PCRF domain-containing protein [Alphaproteobacteria bacterium]
MFDWDVATKRLAELNALSETPDLWNDPEKAQKVMQERNSLDTRINGLLGLSRELSDNLELAELAEAEGDSDTLEEVARSLDTAKKDAARQQLEALLSGEADANDTYLEVHAGAGGTDSKDGGNRLLRLYTHWFDRRKF